MHQSPVTPSEFYTRQGVLRILPILGTCGLVYWLEGGIPPTSLASLIQACQHLNTLWASKGPDVLLPLVLLTAQVLCVGIAWGFLLWLIVREVRALLPSNASPSTLSVSSVPYMAKAATTEDRSSSFSAPHISPRPNVQAPVYQHAAPLQSPAPPLHPVVSTPFNSQESGKPDLLEPKLPQLDETYAPGILNRRDPQGQAASSEFLEENEDDDAFIFGHPLEGPLPDVFRHDLNLRKAIMEQNDQAIDPTVEQTKSKKKGLKKNPLP